MATPSLSLRESLIGAIPVEEGAALVARVGERATITAKSGSIEVGSVALTVEAMDDLIAQVLPPDQLESLQENGTVHFEFTPPVIGGEFAVLAASTPGDRWLEIRRRSVSIATAPAAAAEAVRQAVAPAPAATAVPVADEAEVAQLLSRFHAPDTAAAVPDALVLPAAPEAPGPSPSFETFAAPALHSDFDLSATLPAKELTPEPPPAPPVAALDAGNDDLSIPANLDFPEATSDFDLDGLSLPETLPGGQLAAASGVEPPPFKSEDFDHEDCDHIETRQAETSGMAKSFTSSTAVSSPLRSRSVVLLSVVLGIVVLSAAGWFAAQRYLAAPPVAVVTPPPAPHKPALPKPGPRKAADAPATAVASVTPAAGAPVATSPAAKPRTEAVARKTDAPPPVPRPVPQPSVAKANAAAPAPAIAREGFAVQVAAVRERDEADRMVAKLVTQGYSGYLIRGQGAAADFYRVRVGAFKDRQAAEEVAARLERAEGVKPWIVRETP